MLNDPLLVRHFDASKEWYIFFNRFQGKSKGWMGGAPLFNFLAPPRAL